jgi:hypothetical protein
LLGFGRSVSGARVPYIRTSSARRRIVRSTTAAPRGRKRSQELWPSSTGLRKRRFGDEPCTICDTLHQIPITHVLRRASYMIASLAKPVRPKRTQPVLPESFTATMSARSPLRRAPRMLPNGRVVGGDDLGLYCGPVFLIGPLGSSGSPSNTSSSCAALGSGVTRALESAA